MTLYEIKDSWNKAICEVLVSTFPDEVISCLAHQTIDSIRRVNVYRAYKVRAQMAEENELPYYHTYTPYILAQRSSLSLETRVWIIYLATYFGKSDKSKWNLFSNAAFNNDKDLIKFEFILENKGEYFNYLRSLDFFENSKYSNHRKYTQKALDGKRGVFNSFDFMIGHIKSFALTDHQKFDEIYHKALKIPNFGRMAAFDFTSSLCKCELNVDEPLSMYHKDSTGPLSAIKTILEFAGVSNFSKKEQVVIGDELLKWFMQNSNIYMLAQVLEDAICNWQKSPRKHIRYFG